MIEKNKENIVNYFYAWFVVFCVTTLQLNAQNYSFKQLRIEDGLSQSTIFASLQDSKGYMWFATRSGLDRYDGYEFKVYYNDPKDSTTLSDDGTNSICEDKDSNIWVGTIYGNLNRFDRNTEIFVSKNISEIIKFYPEQNDYFFDYPLSFSRNQKATITSIIEDSKGNLWVGTWGFGLIKLDKNFNLLKHFYFDENNNVELKSNRVLKVIIDEKENIWAATFGGGLSRLKLKANSANDYLIESVTSGKDAASLPDNKLLTLLEDSDHNIWIGSYYSGLIFIDKEEVQKPLNQIKFFSHKCPKENSKLTQNTVISLAEDQKKQIWVGTFGGGLICYNRLKNESKHFFNDPLNINSLGDNDVLSLSVDRSGIIWAGSHLGAGVTKIQVNNFKFNLIQHSPGKTNTLNDGVVWSILKDKSDILWIGTYKGGINKYNLKTQKFSYITKSDKINPLSSNHIRVIREDNYGNLWIGTYDGGLNLLNKNTGEVKVFKNDKNNAYSISSNQVQDIYIISDSVYLIATFGGGLNKLIIKGNPFNQILKFQALKFNPNDSQSISDNRVYKIYKTKDNVLWIATYGGGLNRFNFSENTFHRMPINSGTEDKFNIQNLMTICEDSYGILWLGSYGGSLTSYDRKSNKYKRYSFNDGFTSGVVYGILEDKNKNLWISSDNGLFRFNLVTKDFKRFDIQDGVQSLEFSGGAYLKDEEGNLYFGGINGLNFFNPDEIKTNNYVPPIVITSVKILNEEIKGERKEFILDYKKNFISFEFAALDYSDPRDNQYSYMLEGLQNEWQFTDASSRFANYTNLLPGTYTFKVRGSNNDGIWNDDYVSIRIIILHPFWQTWWFITLAVLMIAAVLYYVSTIRIKNLLAIEKLKSKLAADLHDNVGAGLTEISILSELASRKNNSSANNITAELKKISERSRQLVDAMSDIVWVVNPKRDSLHDLILRLKDTYSELLESYGIQLKVKNLEKIKDYKLPMDVKQSLFLIFKEAINNSIKHSNCKKIELETNARNKVIEITLSDDGKGFDDAQIYSGEGLKNMQNRGAMIGGKIKIKSSPDTGTIVKYIGKSDTLSKIKYLIRR